jgi:hypothetical protein
MIQNRWLWLLVVISQLIAFDIYGKILLHLFAHGGFFLPADLNCFRINGSIALNRSTVAVAEGKKVCAFMYPPPFLLIATPLSWLSPIWTYILWSAVSSISLIGAARVINLPWRAIILGMASPATLLCVIIGQTGGIISALLLLSFSLASTSPAIAGIAAGFLIIKPQFAMLLPVCYVASRNWTALRTAALTATFLCVLCYLLLGPQIWHDFLNHDPSAVTRTLNLPWEQPFQNIMVSAFMTLRSLRIGLPASYAVQTIITICAVGAAWYLWLPRCNANILTQILATMCLIPLATPYSYIYDLPGLAFLLAGYAVQTKWQTLLPITLFWIITSLYILISITSFLTGSIFLLLLLIYLWPKI